MNKKHIKLTVGSIMILTATGATFYGLKHTDTKNNSEHNNITIQSPTKKIAYADKVSDTVVTEIMEDGYVTLHGDHSHFIKGLVPYNAKIIDKLVLKDKNYKFNKDDVQYELAQGYIIKINNKFFYYPKENISQTNVVDEETAKTISKNSHEEHSHEHSSENHNYVFNPKDIVSETEDSYIVKHGDHFHIIKKNSLNGNINIINNTSEPHITNKAGITSATSDGYLFDPSDIIQYHSNGVTVKHEGHIHFFFYDQFLGTKWQYLIPKNSNNSHPEINPPHNKQENNEHSHHFEFNPADIVSEDKDGYVIKHGDHFHYIEKKDLTNKQKESIKNTKPNKNNSNTETIKDSEQTIEEKINYIVKAYGVPREAIKITNEFFVFNNPEHEYDPSHIHPFAISINRLHIPKVTGDAEIDFENELNSVAERMGISPSKIGIENGKFVIPHGGHSHYINILTKNFEQYFKNKLPDITGIFIAGNLDENLVITKINSLIKDAEKIYNKDEKKLRRIKTALLNFKDQLYLKSNSTEGYIKMLNSFDKMYVNIEEGYTNNISDEDKEITKQHNKIANLINTINLDNYAVTKEQLLKNLYKASNDKNITELNNLEQFVQKLKDSYDRTLASSIYYLHFILDNIDSPYLNNNLQNDAAKLAMNTYSAIDSLVLDKIKPHIVDLINSTSNIENALKEKKTYENATGENYLELNKTSSDNKNKRELLTKLVNDLLSLVDNPPKKLEYVKPNNENSNNIDKKDEITNKPQPENNNSENKANEASIEEKVIELSNSILAGDANAGEYYTTSSEAINEFFLEMDKLTEQLKNKQSATSDAEIKKLIVSVINSLKEKYKNPSIKKSEITNTNKENLDNKNNETTEINSDSVEKKEKINE